MPLPLHESTEDLADWFVNFFETKFTKIRDNFEDTCDFSSPDLPFSGESPFDNFDCLSEDDVTKLLQMAPRMSYTLDPIPISVLKQCSNELDLVITRIINSSLTKGDVPSVFKEVVVTPLLKKPGLKLTYKYYRPVSNLSFMSKLTERAVSSQITEFMEANVLQEPLHSAYHPNHSTETALFKIFDILVSMDDKRAVFLVC